MDACTQQIFYLTCIAWLSPQRSWEMTSLLLLLALGFATWWCIQLNVPFTSTVRWWRPHYSQTSLLHCFMLSNRVIIRPCLYIYYSSVRRCWVSKEVPYYMWKHGTWYVFVSAVDFIRFGRFFLWKQIGRCDCMGMGFPMNGRASVDRRMYAGCNRVILFSAAEKQRSFFVWPRPLITGGSSTGDEIPVPIRGPDTTGDIRSLRILPN